MALPSSQPSDEETGISSGQQESTGADGPFPGWLTRLPATLLSSLKAGEEAETKDHSQEITGASDRVSGWVTLITGVVVSGYLLWQNRTGMNFNEFNLLNIACILWIPMLVVLLLLRRSPSEFGMVSGQAGKGALAALILFLLFTPVIYFFAPKPGPQDYYLFWMGAGYSTGGGSGAVTGIYPSPTGWTPGGLLHWQRLVYHELVMGFYMFGWEWYHRGFLLQGLRKIMPTWGAVLLQAVLFTVLHYGKPWEEVASSFPGGILMGLLALRFGSFLPCFLLHWLVSAGFDVAVLYFHFKGI